jgi:hypothetical protein
MSDTNEVKAPRHWILGTDAERAAAARDAEKAKPVAAPKAAAGAMPASMSDAEAEALSHATAEQVWVNGETKDGPRTRQHRVALHGIQVAGVAGKIDWKLTLQKRRQHVAELGG